MTDEQQITEQQFKQAQREYYAAQRILLLKKAKDSLLDFCHLTMPDPADADNPDASLYKPSRIHRIVAAALEEAEAGRIRRLILTMPPRHGKSELVSKRFPAWFMGRDPSRSVIHATYSGEFAKDFGRDVREIIKQPTYSQVFPRFRFRKGGAAANRFETIFGGKANFVGRGEALTGRGGDLLVLDDPIKDADEAESTAIRNAAWQWFTKVFMTRKMPGAVVVIVMCMTGDTPVLMASGREKPLRDVRPGDEVATYENGRLTSAVVRNWASQGCDSVFRITTRSGKMVKANGRHPFLVDRGGELVWVRLKNLVLGDTLMSLPEVHGEGNHVKLRGVMPPQSVGAFARRTTINGSGLSVIVRRLATKILGLVLTLNSSIVTALHSRITRLFWLNRTAGVPFVEPSLRMLGTQSTGPASCASTIATTRGRSGVFSAITATSLSEKVRPRRSSKPPQSIFGVDEIVAIEPVGTEEVFDIQVDRTENFIANGLVSHNTRWHEDDIVGRLTDPTNPCYSEAEARSWKIIDLPAEARQDDPMGREPGEALWPERFPLEFLHAQKRLDPRGYSALYQQQPTPEEGDLITTDMIKEYSNDELPPLDDLRIYVTSDHATTKDQRNDPNVITTFGVDKEGYIWVLDCWRKWVETDAVVEKMLETMKLRQPLTWWAGKDHITKSIGPFLYRRMREEQTYVHLSLLPEIHDKVRKARSIIGRMSMGMVLFPREKPWFEEAKSEMLKFPNGRHDDFVDTLAFLGRGLPRLVGPGRKPAGKPEPKIGSLAWVKWAGAHAQEQAQRYQALKGF